jgi:hypothetical protein
VPSLTPGLGLAFISIRVFTSMFDMMLKVQKNAWSSMTAAASTGSRDAERN